MDFKKKTKLASILALVLSMSLTHCEFLGLEEDDDDDTALFALLLAAASANGCTGTSPVTLTGDITTNITVRCGLITSTAFVRSGATLTIPAGGQVFGADGSSLFILQGGKLVTQGTAAQPVVFTSAQAVGSRKPGDWGGIVLIGNAQANGGNALQTEGNDKQNYGGAASTNDADSSGSLSYTRIEFAGDTLASGDELNCLSMYTVGSGTNLDHIQCHMGRDDAFEWFGGAVNAKFLVATGTSDDDFDMDLGYHGKLQHLVGYKFDDGSAGNSSSDSRSFEFDGTDGGALPGVPYNLPSSAMVANFTVVGSKGVFTDSQASGAYIMRLRERLTGHIAHGYATGYTTAATAEIRCSDTGTDTTVHSTVFVPTGTTSNNGASCTMNQSATVTATGVQLTAEADEVTGTAPNLIPTGGVTVTGLTALHTQNAAFNDGFFDNTTYAGAIDPAGADWTAGWTTWVNK
ncbi:MAG: hypothetical protein RIF32_10275 [Leptospirales bacterium]|jgi:hypothetical protein